MKTLIWIIVILIVLIGGYYLIDPKEDVSDKEVIKIGAILSLTGDAAIYGEMAKRGIDLAVEEINKSGGNIEVVVEDDKTSPKDSVSSFRKLLDIDKVDAVIGGLWNFTAQPLIPIAKESKITFISPSSLRIENSLELNEESFVMLTDFEDIILELRNYVETEEVDNLAVVRFASDFGREISKTLRDIMSELDRKDLIEEEYNEIGVGDFRTIITKLKDKEIETVFLDTVDFDTVSFIKQSRELEFYPKVITYTSVLDALKNTEIDKDLLEGIVVLNWEVVTEDFNELFESKYGLEPGKSADKAYNAIYVLYEAIADKGNKTTSEYIEENTFNTINGDISFTKNHTVDNILVEVGVIEDGEFVKYE